MSLEAPDLRGSGIRIGDLCAAAFWRAFSPDLHVGDLPPRPESTEHDLATLSRRMARDGYFSGRDERLVELAAMLSCAVERCVSVGLPPVFIWAFDEPWECFRMLRPVITHFLGDDYRLLPAFWAWHVDPRKSERGWLPHRDNSRSLAADGSPRSLTTWMPLSEATPLNSCMYVMPAHLDPYYGKPTTPDSVFPDLSLARAVPAKPGDFLIWNQAVLHWGSASSEFAEHPRMSMALEFQRADMPPMRQPLLDAKSLPGFGLRMRLIAMQLRQYTHMYRSSDELLRLAQLLQTAEMRP